MKTITGSASKIAFLTITATLCIAFLYEVIRGIIVLDAKDFMGLALLAFGYYFTKNGSAKTTPPFSDQKGE